MFIQNIKSLDCVGARVSWVTAHLWLVNGLREDIVMWNFQQGTLG